MKILKSISIKLIVVLLMCGLFGCKKQDEWLNVKSSKASVVPQTLKDFQALLNNYSVLNNSNVTAGIVGSDNININTADIGGLFESERNLYLWNKAVWVGGISYEWNYYYSAIETANLVLEGLNTLDPNQPGLNDVKGQACFYRALYYYNLAQLFCKPYNQATSSSDLGLPIRLSSDVNKLVQRSTLQQVYDQIIGDATTANNLLNATQSYLQRPSSLAAKALLAKVYLVQQDYVNAGKLADDVLKVKPALLDYNNTSIVSNSFAYKFPPNGTGNPEIIFYGEGAGYTSPQGYLGCIGVADPLLYQSYSANDLRKTTLYGLSVKGYNFVGSYTGNFNNFFGFATNEMYLIRSECSARSGNAQAAMDDLNKLLVNRFVSGKFTPLVATDADNALQIVLAERRKELPNVSTIRWEDLRRLNSDPRFKVTVTRVYAGQTYTLVPNDPKYVLPIPEQEIQLSGLTQNAR